MKYALLIYGAEKAWESLGEAERKAAYARHDSIS